MTALDFAPSQDITWGLSRAVVYVGNGAYIWPGLYSVEKESNQTSIATTKMDSKQVDTVSPNHYQAKFTSLGYPDILRANVDNYGYAESTRFGLTYREEKADGYLIHVLYNVFAVAAAKKRTTLGSSGEVTTLEWSASTNPRRAEGLPPISHLILDSSVAPQPTSEVEQILYGTDAEDPRLPSPNEIVDIFGKYTYLTVIDNGDGTFTLIGPPGVLRDYGDGRFQARSHTISVVGGRTFTASTKGR